MPRETHNQKVLRFIIEGKDTAAISKESLMRCVMRESEIQQSCVQWFQLVYPQLWNDGMLFHIPNEGIRLGGQGKRIKREGLVKGVADLCLSVPRKGYGALYIEMKKPGGRISKEQKEWGANTMKHGNLWAVCYSFDDFVKTVSEYLKD